MSETTAHLVATRKAWELDPTERNDYRDPDDVTRWLEKYTTYRKQLARCKSCPLLGRGAICAAELVLPDPAAATLLMMTCETGLAAGYGKSNHGHESLRTHAVGSKMLKIALSTG